MKESKGGSNKNSRIPANSWMENPYQDVIDSKNLKPHALYSKRQFFAHTDNNLKGISSLTKDEGLLSCSTKNQKNKAAHNNSSTNDENLSSYYFYPQKFSQQEEEPLPEFS